MKGKHPKRYPVGSMALANWQQLCRIMKAEGKELTRIMKAEGMERRNGRVSRAHRLEAALQETREAGYYASAQEQRKQLIRVHARVLELVADLCDSQAIDHFQIEAILREAAADIRKLGE
jgi:hypothetical protein